MIVAFTGYAQSGKDTAAKALIKRGWERRAFADALKEEVYEKYVNVAAIVDSIGWDAAKTTEPRIRQLLQEHGMAKRAIDEDYWVKLAFKDAPERTVITDCRFSNEVKAINALGGMVVRIEKEGVGPVNKHVSDTGILSLPVFAVIRNDGTVQELWDNVLELVYG